jgi:quercetin dioxygenase-like cupin family protein
MSRYFPSPDDCGHHIVFGSTRVRTYAGDHVQVSIADIPAGGVVDWHAHPNEQLGVMVSGEATFYIGDEEKRLGPGEVFFIPGGVRHKVVAHEQPVRAVDIFYPIREEYR